MQSFRVLVNLLFKFGLDQAEENEHTERRMDRYTDERAEGNDGSIMRLSFVLSASILKHITTKCIVDLTKKTFTSDNFHRRSSGFLFQELLSKKGEGGPS